MSWMANQIYAKHLPAVVAALACEPFLANQMFLVETLDGIRFAVQRGSWGLVFEKGGHADFLTLHHAKFTLAG